MPPFADHRSSLLNLIRRYCPTNSGNYARNFACFSLHNTLWHAWIICALKLMLKIHLMTVQASFYNVQIQVLCTCAIICVVIVRCIHAEYVSVSCQHTLLHLRLSQQGLWLTWASSLSSLSLSKVHLREWCWSAIRSNTERRQLSQLLLTFSCSQTHGFKVNRKSDLSQRGKGQTRRGSLRDKVERKWNHWWSRWRVPHLKWRIWKGKDVWIVDIN